MWFSRLFWCAQYSTPSRTGRPATLQENPPMADQAKKPGPKADILKINDPEKALDDLLNKQPEPDRDEKDQDDNAPAK